MSNDELIKTLYHALPGSWMINLVMQGFNYAHHSLATFLEICERFESFESAKDKHTVRNSKAVGNVRKLLSQMMIAVAHVSTV